MINKFKKLFRDYSHRCNKKWDITYEELKTKVKNGAVVLDVRSIQEYNEGHLREAIHLADYDIPSKHNIVIPNKESEVVVYCQNGGRSKNACKNLKKLGYKNVYNLCGGLDNVF